MKRRREKKQMVVALGDTWAKNQYIARGRIGYVESPGDSRRRHEAKGHEILYG